MHVEDEPYVADSRALVWPRYSYWTIGYMLSARGAMKLLRQEPLTKMIPVDEYLPIMFDQHPEYVYGFTDLNSPVLNCFLLLFKEADLELVPKAWM